MSSPEGGREPRPHRPADTRVTTVLARVLDDLVTVPGTRYRVGLDPVVGLVPVVGDAVGVAVGLIVFTEAIRNRVPVHVLFRMGWNLLVDGALGLLPFVGDVADAAHKATSRNLRLVERALDAGKTADVSARGYVARAVGAVALVVLGLLALSGFAIWGLLRVVGVL